MRRAAIRRAEFELGIRDLFVSDLHVGSRILYYAESCTEFAEHELDYIVFARKDIDLAFKPNPSEVQAVHWVGLSDLDGFLHEQRKTLISN